MPRKELAIIVITITLILSSIFGVAFAFFSNPVSNYTINLPSAPRVPQAAFTYGERPALSDPAFFERVKQQFITEKADFIEADLSAMILRAYEQGEVKLEVPIKTIGREGSWWETPAGLYKVNSKERNHFSSIGRVYMPWSLNFQGNFYIHGWPYEPGGAPVAGTYSGGCIRLETADAEKLYKLVNTGTPVLVFRQDLATDNFRYQEKSPNLTARAYLAADLRNNFVFLKHQAGTVAPIASLAKLMTALIATEFINLDNLAIVSPEALVATSKPRLKNNQEISIYQLLFPLLLESSNEAAETIARHYGRELFIQRMNEKAFSLGMKHTHFADPAGILSENTSTAEDLFMLAKYIYNNRSFIFNLTAGKLKHSAYGASVFPDLQNFNNFADEASFIGGKVGQSTSAGETELSVFELPLAENAGTRPVVFITLGSSESGADIASLRDYVLSNFRQRSSYLLDY